MKVDFDITLTVIATGLYRLLGKHLHGFGHAKARQNLPALPRHLRPRRDSASASASCSHAALTTPC